MAAKQIRPRLMVRVEEDFLSELNHLLPALKDHRLVPQTATANSLLVILAKRGKVQILDEMGKQPKIVKRSRR